MNSYKSKMIRPGLLFALLVTLIMGFSVSTASAQRVANPGNFTLTNDTGFMKVGSLAQLDLSAGALSLPGSIDTFGNLVVPNSAIGSPVFNLCEDPSAGCDYEGIIYVHVVGDPSGSINPLTGAGSLTLNMWIQANVTKPVTANCNIGTAGSPISIPVTTGTSGALTGSPYDVDTGKLTLVNGTIALPGPSGGGLCGVVGGQIGLPSSSGNNLINFGMVLDPKLQPGVKPIITSSNDTVDGGELTLSGLDSQVIDGANTYQWDFNNDGVWDTSPSTDYLTTTTFNGSVGDVKTVRLRVVDYVGDAFTGKKQIQISRGRDFSVAAQAVGDFEVGGQGTYRMEVTNEDELDMPNAVSVKADLPAGLSFVPGSTSGTGWTCSNAGSTVTCKRGPLASGETSPPAEFKVSIAGSAYPTATPTFTVMAPHDPVSSNDSTTVPTSILAPDMNIAKTHDYAFREGASPKNIHVVTAKNVGSIATKAVNPTTITDTLPAGLTPVSASGTGWTCNIAGQTVTCTNGSVVAPGESLPSVEIQSNASIVGAGGDPSDKFINVDNTATVSNGGDVALANDSATDPTMIIDTPDLRVVKSHFGNPRAGSDFEYTIAVDNRGPQPTDGTTVVTDTVPSNMSINSVSGTDWDCSVDGQDVTCEYAGVIASDTDAPPITLDVHADDPADVVNIAHVTTPGDPVSVNDTSEDPTSVRLIDVALSATGADAYHVNRDGHVLLSLDNLGTSASVGSTVITSTLPAGVTVQDASGPGWDCSASTGSHFECAYTNPVVPGDDPVELDVMLGFGIAAAPSAELDFHAEAADDYVPTNNDASVTADIFAMDATVTLTKSAALEAGTIRTYNVDVSNVGTAATTSSSDVTVLLADGLDFIQSSGSSWTCAQDGSDAQLIECSYADPVAPDGGEAAPLGIQFKVNAAARPTAVTTATVETAGDRFPENDSTTDNAHVASPDLGVVSSHSGNFRVGTVAQYNLLVSNHGDAATDAPITLVDTVPTGLDVVGVSGAGWVCSTSLPTVTCDRSTSVGAGADAPVIALKVKPTTAAVPSVTNEVTVSGDDDFNSANDSHSDPTTVGAIDVRADLIGPTTTVQVGNNIAYKVTASNVGSAATIAPVVATGTLPTGLRFSDVGGNGWSCEVNGQDYRCAHAASLAAGATTGELTIDALIRPNVGNSFSHQVTVSTVDDVNSANDTSTAVNTPAISGPNGTVQLQFENGSGPSLRVGDNGVYRVFAGNTGGQATQPGSSVVIDLPEGLEPAISGSSAWPCSVAGQQITCTYLQTIPAGQSAPSFPVNFKVTPDAADSVEVQAEIDVVGDLAAEDDSAGDTRTVQRTDAAVAITQSGDWTSGMEGSYEVAVQNQGTAATSGPVVVVTEIPEGTYFKSVAGDGFNCVPNKDTITCTREATLAAGQQAPSIKVTTTVDAATVGDVALVAAVAANDDVNDANDTAIGTQKVVAPAVVTRGVTLKSNKLKVLRNGTVSVPLLCGADATVKCAGSLSIQIKGSLRASKKSKPMRNPVSGSVSYSVAPGQSKAVIAKFSAKVRKALAKKRKKNARAVVTAKPSSATLTTTTRGVVLSAR